jgi:S1-C subfamily serine protease
MRNVKMAAVGIGVVGTVLCANGDELAQKGRAIFNEHQQAVVTVQLVLKTRISMSGSGGQSSEVRQDITGTVLDGSGLTVLSLTATDPGSLVQAMAGGDEESRLKVETEMTDAKILLDDGTEIPSEIVLRDKDMDLAFLRPKAKPSKAMAALDFTTGAKAEMLDQVVTLNRLGRAAGRAHCASVERVSAIVQKPRLFYIPDASQTRTEMGSPVFTLDGKVLGIMVTRVSKGPRSGLGMMGQSENVTPIILPAQDVMNAAKQVPTVAAGTEEKPK